MSSSGVNFEKYFIPLDEINRSTEKFSRKRYIGGGGFGAVYKGQLSENWKNRTVAVKRLDADSHQGESEFRNELEVISKFHHENIIAFIGYCDEEGEKIIVYEYALNGSLDYHLQDQNKMSCISWAQRLEICIGAAKGLHYLHSGLGDQNRVIHRDVKSANILLDGNMVAKVCDFGLSKLGTKNQTDTEVYTKVAGTQFYLDPSYLESGILQTESDVYSFGVVLFEILSGMLVYRERRIGDERHSLVNIVRRYRQNEPHKIIDPCIRDQIKGLSFETFKLIAYECISLKVSERPTLDIVIKKLEDALNFQMYEHSASTPACGSMIESIIGNLNSASPYDQRIASCEITFLTNHCDQNRVAFGQAGAIPRLTHLLSAPDSRTQEHALTALQNLSLFEDNKCIIVSSGAIPVIVRIIEIGSNVAQENASATLSLIDERDVMLQMRNTRCAGSIPPLVLMLREGTPIVKKNAAVCLCYLHHGMDNIRMVLEEGVVPILLELLIEPQGVLKQKPLNLLFSLSIHPEGKLAIDEAKVVPTLVGVIGTGSMECQQEAVSVLMALCFADKKYMVEAQENGVMGKLKDVREHGTVLGKSEATKLRRMIKYNQPGLLKFIYDKITNIHL